MSRVTRPLSSVSGPVRSAHSTTSVAGQEAEHLVGPDDVEQRQAGVEAEWRSAWWWSFVVVGGQGWGVSGEVVAVAGGCGAEAAADGAVQALRAHQADLARDGVDR
ncbi:MAG: hypothetical protein V9E94_13420 [Microthrixaceae bacterium]